MRLKALLAALSVVTVVAVLDGQAAHAQTTQNDTTTAPPANNVVVQPGDSLSKIATANATTYTRMYDANPVVEHPDVIHPGQQLRVPAADEQLPSRPLPAAPVAAAAAPQAKRSAAARSATPVAAPTGGSEWEALARCESGGNPRTNTGNGYYGAYQFSASTWRSVGGSGLPSEASMEEQTARAQALQQRSGWGQWPACTSKLGLR